MTNLGVLIELEETAEVLANKIMGWEKRQKGILTYYLTVNEEPVVAREFQPTKKIQDTMLVIQKIFEQYAGNVALNLSNKNNDYFLVATLTIKGKTYEGRTLYKCLNLKPGEAQARAISFAVNTFVEEELFTSNEKIEREIKAELGLTQEDLNIKDINEFTKEMVVNKKVIEIKHNKDEIVRISIK